MEKRKRFDWCSGWFSSSSWTTAIIRIGTIQRSERSARLLSATTCLSCFLWRTCRETVWSIDEGKPVSVSRSLASPFLAPLWIFAPLFAFIYYSIFDNRIMSKSDFFVKWFFELRRKTSARIFPVHLEKRSEIYLGKTWAVKDTKDTLIWFYAASASRFGWLYQGYK